jgi:hypothetical protein
MVARQSAEQPEIKYKLLCRKKGLLLVSAKIEIKKIIDKGNKGKIYQTLCV